MAGKPRAGARIAALLPEIEPLLRAGEPIRAVARRFNVNRQTLRAHVGHIVTSIKAGGGSCSCGQPAFHVGSCVRLPIKRDPDRLRVVIAALVRGDTKEEVARSLGVHRSTITRAYLRMLSPTQKQQRARAIQNHRRPSTATVATHDLLYAKLSAAVPRRIAPELRDDIISEMYVAALECPDAVELIVASARRYINAAIGAWASPYGPRSLDAAIWDDGDARLIDRIADPGALEAFDAFDGMQIGGQA